MRGTIIVIIASIVVIGALPALQPATASQGALATPELGERAGDGSRLVAWRGTSALHVTGLCLPALAACIGTNESEDGRYFLPAAGSAGSVVVSWRAVNDSLRELRVRVGGIAQEGASPLVFDILGSSAGEYAVHAEPIRIVAGSWDQGLEWTATFRVDALPMRADMAGVASYQTTTGCLLDLCASSLEQTGDPIVAPWRAQGTLVATWDPKEGSKRISIEGTGFVAQGETPLTLDLSGLEAGDWQVELRPVTLALPLFGDSVQWSAQLVPHG